MKKALLLVLTLVAVSPVSTEAQVDLGFDGGLYHWRSEGESSTYFGAPIHSVRIGFPVGSSVSIDTRAALGISNARDETYTSILLAPGVDFPVGSSGMFLRAEIGWSYVASGDTRNQFGFGGAIGHKRPIGDGPVSLRFEGGVTQWLETSDLDPQTSIFALVGFSVTVE